MSIIIYAMSLKELLDNTISKPWANLYVESIDADAGIQNNNMVVNDSLSLPFISNSYVYAGPTGYAGAKVIQEADVAGLTSDLANIYVDINSLFTTSSSNTNSLIAQQSQIVGLAIGQTGLQNQADSNSAGITGLQQKTTAISYVAQGGSTGTNIASDLTTNGFGDGYSNVFVGLGAGRYFNNPATANSVVVSQRTGNFSGTNQLQNCVLIGMNAGFNMSGNNNVNGSVIIGQLAGQGITNGFGNVIIGRNAQFGSNVNNCVVIGYNANSNIDNQIVIGNPASNIMRSPLDDTVDIGSSAVRYKNLYLSGTGFIQTVGDTTGVLTLNGSVVQPLQSYFEMVLTSGVTLLMTANTWRTSPLANTSKFANLFTNNNSTFITTYTGSRSRIFNLTSSFSFTVANNNSTISFFYSVNGNIVPSSTLIQSIVTAVTSNTVTYNVSLRDLVTLNTNDTIGVAMQSSTSTTITFTAGTIFGTPLAN